MAATREVAESTQRGRVGDDVASWSDVNGASYDRDDSLKENTNPKCILKAAQMHPHHHGGASSQRFSGNLKPTAAPIIGLQGGQLGQRGGARPHHPHPPAIFPKKARTGGGGRQAKPAVPEPGSPKVSCFGKVRSDRERSLRGRPTLPPVAPTRRRDAGCCGGFGLFMRRSRSRNSVVECVDQSPPRPSAQFPLAAAARRVEFKEMETEVPAPAPGLGGLRQFSSGRRAADWAAEKEDDGRVARSGPL